MNGSRLSDDDRARIRARLAAGENVGAVARDLGRHRQTVSRVKEDLERQDGTRLAVKLNFRVTEAEHAHLLAAIRSSDLTVSEAIRHLVRQATSLLALQSPEIEAITAARRDLAAVGNNLNQLARLGAVGRLHWKAGDAALVRKVAARVDDLVDEVVGLIAEAQGRACFDPAVAQTKAAAK
jgi:transposase-like protein